MRIFSSLSPANASLRAAEVPCGKWGGLQSSSVRFHQPGKTRSLAALEGQLTSICSPEPSWGFGTNQSSWVVLNYSQLGFPKAWGWHLNPFGFSGKGRGALVTQPVVGVMHAVKPTAVSVSPAVRSRRRKREPRLSPKPYRVAIFPLRGVRFMSQQLGLDWAVHRTQRCVLQLSHGAWAGAVCCSHNRALWGSPLGVAKERPLLILMTIPPAAWDFSMRGSGKEVVVKEKAACCISGCT